MTKKSTSKKIVFITICSLLLALGVYLLVLYLSPRFVPALKRNSTVKVEEDAGNRIAIPSTGINVAIKEGGEEQLEHGAWHRFPERGNPEIGGNFILSAHSFVWGFTPEQVTEKSYFYSLKDVNVGDEISVRWVSKDYKYKVSEIFDVKPNQTEIEKPSNEPKLTIYTCTEAGSADGRVVVIAKPIN
jgi:sortase A